jgi:hypothetical protein
MHRDSNMIFRALPFVIALAAAGVCAQGSSPSRGAERTSFQVGPAWRPEIDVRSDVVMVYGVDSGFPRRVKSWRDRGYDVQFMTGIAWGSYQEYFTGAFDGSNHRDEGQVDSSGRTIWHGKDVPYVVPSDSYLAYIKSLIKQVIDQGITTIYLEEPEFWARAGYSEAFKKEWVRFYGMPWRPQHESPEATYLSSKLKHQLYFNALKEVFAYAKSYGRSKSLSVRCLVPTHSLLNYSSWEIVSPEASLAGLEGMDGYIAQVWTGTSREPNYFNGIKKERVFETAFLEYGSMQSMTAPTGRKVYFLSDPVEDWPRTWEDYRRNYQKTFVAELMYPMVDNFEVMPWPDRIFQGKFKLENSDTSQGIPPAYATQVLVMVNSLNSMPRSANRVSGSRGIAVLLGNSMMFQRFPIHDNYSDPALSNFYGMALPLLKSGVPVELVNMENLDVPATMKGIKVLVMSYANMKPMSPEVHMRLAAWVKAGGVLIYCGRDEDPFQQVREWWNSGGKSHRAPSDHLFGLMKVGADAGEYHWGKGKVYLVRQNPKEFVMTASADGALIDLVVKAYERGAREGVFVKKNSLYLERGPYDMAAVMDEVPDTSRLRIAGPVIDLFDPMLPVLSEKVIPPGTEAFLYDLKRVDSRSKPAVLCSASRVSDEASGRRRYSFVTKGPSGTHNVMRILLPGEPLTASVTAPGGAPATAASLEWDGRSRTALVQYDNDPDGIRVSIGW